MGDTEAMEAVALLEVSTVRVGNGDGDTVSENDPLPVALTVNIEGEEDTDGVA